jgi:hypothetical protein
LATNGTIVIRGELNWAKIVGDAAPHTGLAKYDKGPKWSVDVTPDTKSRELMKQFGIAGKLKAPKGEKETRKETYLPLSILLNRPDGKQNDPPSIKNAYNQNWDGSKIGNGSIADVKIKVVDYGSASDPGTYLQALRILKHIPYDGGDDFEPLSEDDQFFASGSAEFNDGATASVGSTPTDLDDEIPF